MSDNNIKNARPVPPNSKPGTIQTKGLKPVKASPVAGTKRTLADTSRGFVKLSGK